MSTTLNFNARPVYPSVVVVVCYRSEWRHLVGLELPMLSDRGLATRPSHVTFGARLERRRRLVVRGCCMPHDLLIDVTTQTADATSQDRNVAARSQLWLAGFVLSRPC